MSPATYLQWSKWSGAAAGSQAEYVVICAKSTDDTFDNSSTVIRDFPQSTNGVLGYFSFVYTMNGDGTWQENAPEEPAEKVTPTTAITAATPNNDGTVTLAATVSKTDGVATDADGKVVFTAIGSTGEAAVADGVATWTTEVLTGGQSYGFTAKYVPNTSDKKYNESADSAVQNVTVVAEPAAPQQTDVTVVIPEQQSGLKFTITDGDVALSQAVLEGGSYVANGELGQVKVSDNRAAKTTWALNGSTTDFENTIDDTKTIDGKYLGWAPALIGSSNGGSAGAPVAAGTGDGLKASSTLASAPAGATVVDTTAKAGITLKAPGETAAGSYNATLTLTLI